MNWLTRFSLKNPAAILIMVVIVTVAGAFSATSLKMEMLPDITVPIVLIATPYPGAAPEIIQNEVTKPIEEAVSGVRGVNLVQSISAEHASVVVLQFDYGLDMGKAEDEVRRAVEKVNLPENAMKPNLSRIGLDDFPVLQLSVYGDEDLAVVQTWVREVLGPRLSDLDGVGRVDLTGLDNNAVYVELQQDKLEEHGLTADFVVQMLQANNLSFPVGEASMGSLNAPVRVEKKITSVEELKQVAIPIFPNANAALQESFEQIGKGMAGLGEAVGGLGSAIGGLGQAVGGLGQGVGMLQGQVQLVSAIQQLQGVILGDQIQLNSLYAQLDPENPNEQLQMQIAQLEAKIGAQQQALAELQGQLAGLQQSTQEALSSMQGAAPGSGSSGGSMRPMPSLDDSADESSMEIQLVTLGELALIEERPVEVSSITTTNGKPSVGVGVIKAADANTVEVSQEVFDELERMKERAEIPAGVEIIPLYDQADYIKLSINGMIREGALGAVFAALVILLFLRNIRSTIIAVVSIPMSILITMFMLDTSNITLNIMSLGGIAVAIGRVVDDSIVVIENIYRHRTQGSLRGAELIRQAVREVGNAIFSSTLTTIAVFVPLGLVSGMVGELFRPFALSVAYALLASLLVAVTIVPIMAKVMLVDRKVREEKEGFMVHAYRRALDWALGRKVLVLSLSFLLLLASFGLLPFIGSTFIPETEEKMLQINVELPPGSKMEETQKLVADVEEVLQEYEEQILLQFAMVGSAEGVGGFIMGGGSNTGQLLVELTPDVNLKEMEREIRQRLESLEGEAEITVTNLSSGMMGFSNAVEVNVIGNNMEDIRTATERLTEEMANIEGLVNVTNSLQETQDEVKIVVDQEAVSRVGLTTAQLGQALREWTTPQSILTLTRGGVTQEVYLQPEVEDEIDVEALKQKELTTPTGEKVKVGEIAELIIEPAPASITRQDGRQFATVSGEVDIDNTGAVSAAVYRLLQEIEDELPPGVVAEIGGITLEQENSFQQLGFAMVIAVLAVYLIMVITFGEALAPFAILFSLPFAIIGALLGLFVTGQELSVPALIGGLMLIGIVVTNAIVLIARVIQMKEEGLSTHDALIEAAGTRLRPILMTAVATIGALFPLALALTEGSLIAQSLAVVVIGGLVTSTLLTLFVVPIMYQLLDNLRSRFRKGQAQESTA